MEAHGLSLMICLFEEARRLVTLTEMDICGLATAHLRAIGRATPMKRMPATQARRVGVAGLAACKLCTVKCPS